MTDKKKPEELNEAELDNVTGGFSASGTGNFKIEIDGVKPRLTEAASVRAGKGTKLRAGIRATDGVKIRK